MSSTTLRASFFRCSAALALSDFWGTCLHPGAAATLPAVGGT